MTGLHDGTILEGAAAHLWGCHSPLKNRVGFQHICDCLKGTQDSLI